MGGNIRALLETVFFWRRFASSLFFLRQKAAATDPTMATLTPLSEYSLLPLSHVETYHFKTTMAEVKAEGCSPPELSDAYECLGLSQLLDGDYAEAATNLECACTIQEETHKGVNDEKHEHRLRTKFWVRKKHFGGLRRRLRRITSSSSSFSPSPSHTSAVSHSCALGSCKRPRHASRLWCKT